MTSKTPDLISEWLSEAKAPVQKVTLYQRNDLLSELQDCETELALARSDDMRVLDDSTAADLQEHIDELLEQIDASKIIWHLRPLSDAEQEGLQNAYPYPASPAELENTPPDPESQAAAAMILQGWLVEAAPQIKASQDAQIQAATVRIEFPDGAKQDTITLKQVKAVRAKLGDTAMQLLVQGINQASMREVSMSSPLSQNAFGIIQEPSGN